MERRGRSIVLIGMMGAGKSTVGRLLQRRTGLELYDTDAAISDQFGLTIPEIFDRFGEDRFREAETEALQAFEPRKAAIVVTGGGIVLRQQNVACLRRFGFVVWLEADGGTLFERATRRGNRPLLRTQNPRATIETLRTERMPLYKEAADLRIDTSTMNHDEIADAILNRFNALTMNHE